MAARCDSVCARAIPAQYRQSTAGASSIPTQYSSSSSSSISRCLRLRKHEPSCVRAYARISAIVALYLVVAYTRRQARLHYGCSSRSSRYTQPADQRRRACESLNSLSLFSQAIAFIYNQIPCMCTCKDSSSPRLEFPGPRIRPTLRRRRRSI